MQSPPVTPKRKRRDSDDDYLEAPTSVQGSAQKKAKATPKTPSKAALAKAETAKKREWKAAWNEYVESSYWSRTIVTDRRSTPSRSIGPTVSFVCFEGHVYGSTDLLPAMQYYRLKAAEMDTLPHWEFENKNYPSHPGRSYSHEGVLMLVSRKHAMLAGLHEKGLRDHELLKQGKELFEQEQARLLQRTPNKKRQPHLWKIVSRRRFDPIDWESTPSGSWETPIWEDGRIIGHWLNYQFDPDIGPEDDWMFSTARFRPVGSSKRIELP